MWEWLGKGIFLGVSVAAPVGPIAILCIRTTITFGWRSGILIGLGAASADMVYGGIAGLGLTSVIAILLGIKSYLQLLGGLFIVCMAGQIWRSSVVVPDPTSSLSNSSHWKAYYSTFLLTLSNPMTILAFLALFTGSGVLYSEQQEANLFWLMIGVFAGSMLWWLGLTGIMIVLRLHRSHLKSSFTSHINQLSSVVLACFGVVAVGQALIDWVR